MAGKQSASNVQAGLFLITGIVLAVVVSFVLSGVGDRLQSRSNYTVLISLRDGADGIKVGSPVLVGGYLAGAVKDVSLKDDPANPERYCVFVDIAVRSDLKLHEDALVFVDRPLLGSLAKHNITSLGGENKASPSPLLASGGVLRGRIAPPAFLAQAGYGDEQQSQLKSILKDASDATSKVMGLVDRNDEKIDAIIDNAGQVSKEIKDATPGVVEDVKKTATNAREATEEAKEVVKKVGPVVDDTHKLVKDADDAVNENRPKLASVLDRADSIARKIDEQGVDKAMAAITDFQGTLQQISGLIREETPSLRKAMANARIASDQLKLAITEVRSQPWRLLYQPSRKEVESSVLYDATRSYASAVSDLRAASESLEAAVNAPARPDGQAFERQSIGQLNARLREAFDTYAGAEKALIEKLMKDAGESAKGVPPAK